MNTFEKLVLDIKIKFPLAHIKVDPPERPSDNHWLDIRLINKLVTIEWVPDKGFGFFAADSGYGEGPNTIIPERDKALAHINELLQS